MFAMGGGARSAIAITGVPTGRYKVTVTVKLSDGRSVALSQTYRGCPSPRG
ncbi:MAG: hypothetical protein JST08_20360 [Actinobacteria bacterium]|nr:hypothetical protein [Actinomycetota bacterium]